MTVKLLTIVNFLKCFKKEFFGKSFHNMDSNLCNFCFILISEEKSPNKARTADFNCLFGLNIFYKPLQFSMTSLQVVKPNLWGLINIQK